jgi:hypothetical protein
MRKTTTQVPLTFQHVVDTDMTLEDVVKYYEPGISDDAVDKVFESVNTQLYLNRRYFPSFQLVFNYIGFHYNVFH